MKTTLNNQIKATLFTALPHHFISRIVFYFTRIKSPKAVPAINWFIKAFKVDMSNAVNPKAESYSSFNEFFVRPIKPESRPVCANPFYASPVDGTVSQAGKITKNQIVQAKGHNYSIQKLLAYQDNLNDVFENGSFNTIYLAPYNYHRIHMPCDGVLKQMIHIPGRLFSVAPWTVSAVPDLFARNERVVCIFETPKGMLAMILVGAINVAAIETTWAGLITPPKGKKVMAEQYHNRHIEFKKGEEMGRFNMGSTVILLSEFELTWLDHIKPERKLVLGEAIAS